ncbi:MAG: hypothetical protein GMKNLPBB_02778 [Myxococcota bacterium]|nr:hypothetical protein [Myxococcota bacterium]
MSQTPNNPADREIRFIHDHEGVRCDLHLHSTFSDGTQNPHKIIELARRRGIHPTLTDHNEIRGSSIIVNTPDLVVLPAIEVATWERLEFILYFREFGELEDFFVRHLEKHRIPRRYAVTTLSMQELFEALTEYQAVVSLPHPFAPAWKNIEADPERKELLLGSSIWPRISYVEGHNDSLTVGSNRNGMDFARQQGKPALAVSDSHHPRSLGNSTVVFPGVKTRDDLWTALRARVQPEVHSREAELISRLRDVMNFARKHTALYALPWLQKRWMLPYNREDSNRSAK